MHLRLVAIAVFLLMATCGTNAAVDDPFVYSVRCWEAGSLFADPACSCLGGSAAKLDSRPTFTVVVGSWYAREALAWLVPSRVAFLPGRFGVWGVRGVERGPHARRVRCAG